MKPLNPYSQEESAAQWNTEGQSQEKYNTFMHVPKPKKLTKEEKIREKLIKQSQKLAGKYLDQLTKTKRQVKKARQMPLSRLKKLVQKEVNAYVRERDKDLPCISCGKTEGPWQAGHYIAQGSSGALRFDLWNIHKQCVTCNLYKHGNLIEYRIGLMLLRKKNLAELEIHIAHVEWLEEHRHDIKKWSREELEQIRVDIKQKMSELVTE